MSTSFFSPNPDKAWVEKFFLIYSPIWMGLMAFPMFTDLQSWTNAQLLLHAAVVMLPVFIVPLILHKKYTTKKWYESYFLKVILYLFIFSFWGNYSCAEYFFDVSGIVFR